MNYYKCGGGTTVSTKMATGTTLTLSPTSEGNALAHIIYGMSEQNGTPTPDSPVSIDSALANYVCANSDNTESDSVTSNITLRAIEVASTDDYNLVSGGKYYVADTIDWDGEGYVLTRRVRRISFTSNFQNYSAPGDGGQGFVERYFVTPVVNANIKGSLAYNASTPLSVCNCAENGIPTITAQGKFFLLAPGTNNQRIRINVPDSVTDVATAATWAASAGLYIDFILETPTTEKPTIAQAEELLSLKTYDGGTIITPSGTVAPITTLEYATERVPALALSGYADGRKFECDKSTDGTYVLKATVSSGVVTYSWVSE